MRKIITRRKEGIISGFKIKKKNYIRKLDKVFISKPLFKHTSFNLIIDLFVYNNKTNNNNNINNESDNIIIKKQLYKKKKNVYYNKIYYILGKKYIGLKKKILKYNYNYNIDKNLFEYEKEEYSKDNNKSNKKSNKENKSRYIKYKKYFQELERKSTTPVDIKKLTL